MAASLSAKVQITYSEFASNHVDGTGGGALYANQALIWLKAVSFTGNTALAGGGGVLFWEGGVQPISQEYGLVSPSTPSPVCGIGNSAIYGECVASSFHKLKIYGLPTAIYPGLTFPIYALKLDVYNQTISSDSSSVLQTFTTLDTEFNADHAVTLSGSFIASFTEGLMSLNIVVKPSFKAVDTLLSVTTLYTPPQLYLRGLDSQTGKAMLSPIIPLSLSSNQFVCPTGYILVMDDARGNSTIRQGACSLCSKGTYSVSPLAGSTPGTPSCRTCLSSAVCLGGSSVNFTLGTWIISYGMYRLIGCPPGHQLVNMINGAFSHDAQNCLACPVTSYIFDPNNDTYSCQPCPVGASCDGNSLVGKVNGSLWTADSATGIYMLQSCPAGYQLQAATTDSQQCLLCEASYYCVGGKSPSAACAEGSYAAPGSTSFSACTPTVFVQVVAMLPMTSNEFTATKQNTFKQALADAAGVSIGYVFISSVTAAGRRTSSSIQVCCRKRMMLLLGSPFPRLLAQRRHFVLCPRTLHA